MSRIICPGQDTRFWRPGDIFEVPCRRCGKRIRNPKLSVGCAQWCEHAKECLGFDPKEVISEDNFEVSLVDKLVEAVKKKFGSDQKRITHALLVLEKAQELLHEEKAEPRVVLAAALLHDIGIQEAERKYGSAAGEYHEIEGPPIAKQIMEESGLDDDTIEHVCRIVRNHHSARDIDTLEFRIIWDADNIVNISEEIEKYDDKRIEEIVEKVLKTRIGKDKARKMFLHREPLS